MTENTTTNLLREHLFSKPDTNVYAVLDGASVPDLPQTLWEMEPEHVCLWRGRLEPDMIAVVPYLVRLLPDHPFTDLVLTKGWGNHWGIFALTPKEADLRLMRIHFRRFLMVLDPEGQPIYFRYYDPRVLRAYLPTCNAGEVKTVLGPTSCYVLEDEDSTFLLRLSSDGEKVQTEKVMLTQS